MWRVRHRLATSGNLKHTDYNVVWEELDVFHFATLGFLINANNWLVKRNLPGWFQSDQPIESDMGRRPEGEMHKVLFEEHVYGFVWNPQRTRLEWLIDTGSALVKFSGSAAVAVATLGASAPSLIDSVRDIVNLSGELIATFKKLNEQAKPVVEAIGGAVSDAMAFRNAALGTQTEPDLEGLVGATGYRDSDVALDALDPATRARLLALPKEQKRWLFFTGLESEGQMNSRLRQELEQQMAELNRIMFVVVQQATPVKIHYEIDEIKDYHMICDYKLSAANASLVRVGQTDLSKYTKKIAYLETGRTGSEILVNPWLIEGASGAGFEQWARTDMGETVGNDLFNSPTSAFSLNDSNWQDIKSYDKQRVPLPQELVQAMHFAEGRRLQRQQDLKAIYMQQMRQRLDAARRQRAEQEAARQMEMRMMQQQDAYRQMVEGPDRALSAFQVFVGEYFPSPYNMEPVPHPEMHNLEGTARNLCRRGLHYMLSADRFKLDTKAQFIERTEIQYFIITAKRTNTHLLGIDVFLGQWHDAIREIVGDHGFFQTEFDPWEFMGDLLEILGQLEYQCELYIRQKMAKEPNREKQSRRLPAVQELSGKVISVKRQLEHLCSGYAELLTELQDVHQPL